MILINEQFFIILIDTMHIKKCQKEDIALIAEFYDDIIEYLDNHINYPRWIYKVYPSENSVKAMVEEESQYICISNEKIIGAFVLNAKPQGSYWKANWSQELEDGSYMVLQTLVIDHTMQRQGLASDIIEFCIDKAKSNGYKAIRLDVIPDNYPAKKLFEKNGFEYVGDVDLELEIGNNPLFSLYELNF